MTVTKFLPTHTDQYLREYQLVTQRHSRGRPWRFHMRIPRSATSKSYPVVGERVVLSMQDDESDNLWEITEVLRQTQTPNRKAGLTSSCSIIGDVFLKPIGKSTAT
jgi:hypothetical protein